jgi:protein-export membrane protein SecD
MTKYKKTGKAQITTSKVRLSFAAIFLLTLFMALVVTPKLPESIPTSGWFNQFKIHLGLDLQGGSHLVYQADVSELKNTDIGDRVEALRDVIERRVNAYGVSEPVVQTNFSGDNYRIIVELAGVKDVNEAIAIIDKTPHLEFKLQDTSFRQNTDVATSEENSEQTKAQEILDRALAGEDFSNLAKEFSEDPTTAPNGGELPWEVKGAYLPEVDQAIFEDLKVGEISPELVVSQSGYHIIKKLEERLNENGEREARASHIVIEHSDADLLLDANWIETGLTGKYINNASLTFEPNTNQPIVLLEFDDEGKDIFAQLTTDNVGRPIGIFLDNEVRSKPVVQEPIKDGKAQISGSFTVEEAKQLVKDLNLGALPVPIELISQQTVGATLGSESVEKSLLAGIIGLLAAALFMLVFYRLPGLLAVFALAVYTLISLAIFEMIPVTMTLAGVAGFILSIGMAVDANILIFERTKEELYKGKSLNSSIENGFVRAWTSIRDSNISSIITCIILAWFGSSIIKGFAITLAIGILISMFSAITVTRTFMRMIVSKRLENKLSLFGVKKVKDTE